MQRAYNKKFEGDLSLKHFNCNSPQSTVFKVFFYCTSEIEDYRFRYTFDDLMDQLKPKPIVNRPDYIGDCLFKLGRQT